VEGRSELPFIIINLFTKKSNPYSDEFWNQVIRDIEYLEWVLKERKEVLEMKNPPARRREFRAVRRGLLQRSISMDEMEQ
jgi:hypothetical protein